MARLFIAQLCSGIYSTVSNETGTLAATFGTLGDVLALLWVVVMRDRLFCCKVV